VGGVVLHAALNPLGFPDVDRVVPKNLGRMVRVDDAGQFSDAIKRVSDIQRASNTDGCHLELRADAVGLRCIDANQGEACEEFPALVAGTGVRVRANGQYLIDALAQMSDDESVTDMHVGEQTDPIMFTNSHGHAVVMPMRI
jgi:DNA polymerase III sliding clamp (beta) subunit (PCNA family)